MVESCRDPGLGWWGWWFHGHSTDMGANIKGQAVCLEDS